MFVFPRPPFCQPAAGAPEPSGRTLNVLCWSVACTRLGCLRLRIVFEIIMDVRLFPMGPIELMPPPSLRKKSECRTDIERPRYVTRSQAGGRSFTRCSALSTNIVLEATD
eukprot:357659-Pyramimonas_sp.AAC.1